MSFFLATALFNGVNWVRLFTIPTITLVCPSTMALTASEPNRLAKTRSRAVGEPPRCDPKWWGIAIRIEDDILITPSGPINLSAAAPREIDEIEKMITQDSPLDEFVLPVLDSFID